LPHCSGGLHNPWLTPIPIGADTPSHIDLSPTLRQNWSPRAKWHFTIALWLVLGATNRFSYFAATAAAAAAS